MRARILFLTMLLGALVSVPVPPSTAAEPGPRARLHAPRGMAEVGKPLRLTAQLSGFRGAVLFDVQVRTARGWRSALPDNRHVRRTTLRPKVVPTKEGRNVYRVMAIHRQSHIIYSRPVVVRAKFVPHAKIQSTDWYTLRSIWDPVVTVWVTANRLLPSAPTLHLQQRSHGGWRTVATSTGRRGHDSVWWFELTATVTDVGPLRVAGSGSRWTVALPVTGPPITDAGAIEVDGPTRTLEPAVVTATRHLTFDATAGERVSVIIDGPAEWHVRLPDGTSWDYLWPGEVLDLPTTGQYAIEVRGSGSPVTLRLAHPVVADATLGGPATIVPAVADARIPRQVTFEAQAGDFVIGRATTRSPTPASCSTGIVSSPDGRWEELTTSRNRTVSDIRRTGTFTASISCPTGDPVAVDLQRVPVHDVATGSPVSFAADRTQPVAFRFTTTIDNAHVTATLQSTAPMSATWVVSRLDDTPFAVRTGYLDRWIPEAGEHLLLLEPIGSDDQAATLELAEEPCPARGSCG